MKRVVLDDGSWFDADEAEEWDDEETDFFESILHRLWLTRHGAFVAELWTRRGVASPLSTSHRPPRDSKDELSGPWELKWRKKITDVQALRWLTTRGRKLPPHLEQHLVGNEI